MKAPTAVWCFACGVHGALLTATGVSPFTWQFYAFASLQIIYGVALHFSLEDQP